MAQKAAVETAQKTTQEGILEFCEKAIKEAMQNITQSLTERLGKTSGGKIAKALATKTDNVIKLLKKSAVGPLADFVGKKLAKLGAFIGTNTAVAATGIGILGILAKDAIWMTCGAINSAGKGGAARLFKCEQDVVDWKMRLIASSVAALAETTPGTVVDIVNEIVTACCSYDFICDFATSIYLTLSNDEKDKILLQQENTDVKSSINESNFEEFQDLIRQMFCLETIEGGKAYDPADALAKRIAEKIAQGHQKKAQQKGEKPNVNIFSRYVSVLSVGLQKDMNDLLNYTVPQLFNEIKRFQMKQDFDFYIQAKMAGAKDLEEVKNWMDELHS